MVSQQDLLQQRCNIVSSGGLFCNHDIKEKKKTKKNPNMVAPRELSHEAYVVVSKLSLYFTSTIYSVSTLKFKMKKKIKLNNTKVIFSICHDQKKV